MIRVIILIYGFFSYLIGVVGMLAIILPLTGHVSFGFLKDNPAPINPPINPWVWNAGLVAAWGIIHTATARPSFKAALTKFIPEAAERSTYVLIAGFTSIILTGYWQSISGQIWQVDTKSLTYLIWLIFLFGWAFLFAATFAINHFDLFGLRQVYHNFKNQPLPPIAFTQRAMYKYIRHPIQTGVLIGVWATPSMSATQIILSLGFTAYIFIGLWFEERDLMAEHPEDYAAYRRKTGKLFPKFKA